MNRLFCFFSLGLLCSCAEGDFGSPARSSALSVEALMGTWNSSCQTSIFNASSRDNQSSLMFNDDKELIINTEYFDTNNGSCTENLLLVTATERFSYWISKSEELAIPENAALIISTMTNYNFNYESQTLDVTPTAITSTNTGSQKIADELNAIAFCKHSHWQDNTKVVLTQQNPCHNNTLPQFAKLRIETYINGSPDGLAISTSSTLISNRPDIAGSVSYTKE